MSSRVFSRCVVRRVLSAIALAASLGAPASAEPDDPYPSRSLLIDDFSTGPWRRDLRPAERVSCKLQPGAMMGGYRHINFINPDNPFGRTARLEIRRGGPLIVETGVRGGHRLEVGYGWDASCTLAGLSQDLTPYDRFRVWFDSSDLVENFNVVIYSDHGAYYSILGDNPLPGAGPFCLEFPFAHFDGRANFGDVDALVLIFQSGSEFRANDFAVTSISAESVRNPTCKEVLPRTR